MRILMRFTLLIVLGLWMGSASAPTTLQAQVPPEVLAYADLVLYNGKVLAGEGFSPVEAVAIRDGKFLGTGDNESILRMVGSNTRKIDLQGKSVIPGLIGTHEHGAWVGNASKRGVDGQTNFETKASGLEEVRQIVAARPPGEWLQLSAPDRPALFSETTGADLDLVAPRNPLVIATGNNWAVANSLALAKLDPDTPGIRRDPDTGEPTGQLWGAAVGVVSYELMPWPDIRDLIEEQKERLATKNAEGLTTLVGRAQGLSVSILNEVWKRGELTARVRLGHEFLRQNPNPEAYLKRVGNLSGFGDDWMKILGTTVSAVDGTSTNATDFTTFSQINRLEGNYAWPYGMDKWPMASEDPSQTETGTVILANRYGWSIANLHSKGDAATRRALEAYAKANEEKPLEGAWGIDHQPMQNPETLRLLKELKVIPSLEFINSSGGDGDRTATTVHVYGADRVRTFSPTKTMLEMGIKVVIESKGTGPLLALERFVTRTDGNGRVWAPEEKIDRLQGLRMLTEWAALYAGEEEGRLGLIKPGMLGDCVVLDGDFLTVPDDQIAELGVEMTIVGGKIVFEKGVSPEPR